VTIYNHVQHNITLYCIVMATAHIVYTIIGIMFPRPIIRFTFSPRSNVVIIVSLNRLPTNRKIKYVSYLLFYEHTNARTKHYNIFGNDNTISYINHNGSVKCHCSTVDERFDILSVTLWRRCE